MPAYGFRLVGDERGNLINRTSGSIHQNDGNCTSQHLMILLNNDFKTIQFAVYFSCIDEVSTRVYRFLLPKLLTSHTNKYPTKLMVSTVLEDLYGAYFKTRVEKVGNLNIISIVLTIADPKIMKDESLLHDALQLFRGVIFDHDQFKVELFNEEKRMFIEQWETLIDKKRLYAQTQFNAFFFEGDSEGYPLSGTLDDVKKLSVEHLFAYYQKTLKQDRMDVVVNGYINQDEQALIQKLLCIGQKKSLEFEMSFRQPKGTVGLLEEETTMKQAILKLGFHYAIFRNDPSYTAAILADIILGGYPESRLFKQIREKEALCYDISSNYDPYKGVLLISSGVDLKQKNKALESIKKLVETLKKKGISKTELDHAKAFFTHQVKTSLDNQSVLTKRAFIRDLLNYNESVEERLEAIEQVTLDAVNSTLEKLHLDTVYILHGGKHHD
ncbi:MAG: insulinase family protein [Acholeplasmataceae bacterium]|nr:insulinase family protein [Acholeplasmataceae bacterium]